MTITQDRLFEMCIHCKEMSKHAVKLFNIRANIILKPGDRS